MICPIPNSALPVVEILRRDVKRPEHLFPLHVVMEGVSFPYRLKDAVFEFDCWWDSLTEADAAEAMEMIWPTK